MIKKALIGMHNHQNRELLKMEVEDLGYDVESVSTREEFEKRLKEKAYDVVLQDANLGCPGLLFPEPAEEASKIIKEKGYKVVYMSVTGRSDLVDHLNSEGIPCKDVSLLAAEFIPWLSS